MTPKQCLHDIAPEGGSPKKRPTKHCCTFSSSWKSKEFKIGVAIIKCYRERFCRVLMVTMMHTVPLARYSFPFATKGPTTSISTSAQRSIFWLYRPGKQRDPSVTSVSARAELLQLPDKEQRNRASRFCVLKHYLCNLLLILLAVSNW